jgi:hypothetical protein
MSGQPPIDVVVRPDIPGVEGIYDRHRYSRKSMTRSKSLRRWLTTSGRVRCRDGGVPNGR